MEISFNFSDSFHLSGDYMILKPNISEDEFWEIANEDANFELIDGVLVIHSPASTEHEDLFHYLSYLISSFLEEPKYGKVFGSRLVMRLSEKWNPEPDIMILLPEHFDRIKSTKIDGPADVVIEILSEATRELDLSKKVPKYLEMGVQEIWIIDPSIQTITIHTPRNITIIDDPDSKKVIPTIVSRVKIDAHWLWHRDQFPAIEIIRDWLKNQ